jgi:hypothetical protein
MSRTPPGCIRNEILRYAQDDRGGAVTAAISAVAILMALALAALLAIRPRELAGDRPIS